MTENKNFLKYVPLITHRPVSKCRRCKKELKNEGFGFYSCANCDSITCTPDIGREPISSLSLARTDVT